MDGSSQRILSRNEIHVRNEYERGKRKMANIFRNQHRRLHSAEGEVWPGATMKMVSLILIFLCANGTEGSQEEVQKFLLDNGHKYVTIVLGSSKNGWLRFRPQDIFLTRTMIGEQVDQSNDGFNVFICGPDGDNLRETLEIIVERKNGMSLLLLDKSWLPNVNVTLKSLLQSLEARIFFYVGISSSPMTWYHVISLKSGSAISELSFHPNSRRAMETYDLQGLQITSTSLTWAPFYTIDDCNEEGLQCKTAYGYLHDYMNLLADKLNFTYVSHKDTDDDWGTLPKSGPFSLNGTWGGVVGNVILGKYDMSISSYTWNVARSELMQFVPILRTRRMLALTPQRPAMDLGLFIRAFTLYSWAGIMGVTTVAAFCLLLGYWLTKERDTFGGKMLAFTIWTFFVIVNAYYGGKIHLSYRCSTQSTTPFFCLQVR